MWLSLVAQITFLLAKHCPKNDNSQICFFKLISPSQILSNPCVGLLLCLAQENRKIPSSPGKCPLILLWGVPPYPAWVHTGLVSHCGPFSLPSSLYPQWLVRVAHDQSWVSQGQPTLGLFFSGAAGKKGGIFPVKLISWKPEATWEWRPHRGKQSGEMEGKGPQTLQLH